MKLTKIDKLESMGDGIDLCRLEFDDGKDTAYILYNHENLLPSLGKDVVASFRLDLYKGTTQRFVNTLAMVGVVHTLEKEDHIKLYTNCADNHCSISFRDIADGATAAHAIIYVVDVRYDSSSRATWADLTVQDRERRQATLRLFDPVSRELDLKGRYIMCDLRRNRYGLSTSEFTTVDSTYPYSPEVEVARSFVTSTFAEEPELLNVLQSTGYMDIARRYIDMEPGYILVRLACALDIVNEIGNMSKEADIPLLRHAVLLSTFHIFNSASTFKQDLVTFVMANKHNFPGSREACQLLFSEDKEYATQRAIYNKVQEMADTLVKAKKGWV